MKFNWFIRKGVLFLPASIIGWIIFVGCGVYAVYLFIDIDSIHCSFVVLERAVNDDDKIADLEVTLELRCLLAHTTLNDTEFRGT